MGMDMGMDMGMVTDMDMAMDMDMDIIPTMQKKRTTNRRSRNFSANRNSESENYKTKKKIHPTSKGTAIDRPFYNIIPTIFYLKAFSNNPSPLSLSLSK